MMPQKINLENIELNLIKNPRSPQEISKNFGIYCI